MGQSRSKSWPKSFWPKSVWPKSAMTVEAPWRDELRKGLVSCCLTVGIVSRCCFRNESGQCRVMTSLSLVLSRVQRRWGRRSRKDGELVIRWLEQKTHDQKELHILNRTLRWCKDGLVFAANVRHAREVVDELGLSKSKPVSSPATVDGVTRCQGDEIKPLDEEG